MKKSADLRKFTATMQDAASSLGKGFSRTTIKRRINNGVWVQGIHWINVGVGETRQNRLYLDGMRDRASWKD